MNVQMSFFFRLFQGLFCSFYSGIELCIAVKSYLRNSIFLNLGISP